MYYYFLPRNDNDRGALLSLAQIYLQLYGSEREAHGLKYRIEIGDEALISTCTVLTIDDKRKDINDNLKGLSIPFAKMKEYISALGNFHFVCYIPINIFFHFI